MNNKIIDIDRLSRYHENINTLLTTKQESLVSGDNIKTINGESILGEGDLTIGGGAQAMVSTTWAELKELRDNASLVAGTWYRITDYVTTTSQTQTNTMSAGHPFDVVVLATGENTLSEEARAIRHEGDISMSVSLLGMNFFYKGVLTVDGVEWFEFENPGLDSLVTSSATPAIGDIVYPYYDGMIATEEGYPIESVSESENEYFLNNKVNIDSWKIWYCLDNDKMRFPWAHAKTGKSIMVQADEATLLTAEYNGTYEYEGIMYYRWDASYRGFTMVILTVSDNLAVGDTTSVSGILELNLFSPQAIPIIQVNEASDDEGFGVIYRMIDERDNDCPYDFKNIQFLMPITDGQFDSENGIEEWVFTFNLNSGDGSISTDYSNTSYCFNNIIKSSLLGLNSNVFLNRYTNNSQCHSNTLETNCNYNIFNDSCHSNTLETNCNYNIFDANISNCKVSFDIQYETIPYSSIFDTNDEVYVSYDYNNKLSIGSIKSYIDSNCNIPVITTTESSQSLVANTYYKWLNTPTNITITLTSPSNSNILNNYMFEFTASSSGCTLSVPSSIKWLNEIPPIIESNKTYQISIINNLATVAKFG